MNNTKKKSYEEDGKIVTMYGTWTKETYDKLQKYFREYDSMHNRQVKFRLNRTRPEDVAMWMFLQNQENLTQYLKQLIQEDMEKQDFKVTDKQIQRFINKEQKERKAEQKKKDKK